ncbi:phytanoyl-CoA dioxygenase family protein [soil metagenome]
MNQSETILNLRAGGIDLDTSPEAFGFLRESREIVDDVDALRQRMELDGYLYIPGFFDREDVREVRLKICEVLANEGLLNPSFPIESAIASESVEVAFRPDIVTKGPPRASLEKLIYGDRIMAFYAAFLGGESTHFDFTWLRAVSPGKGTYPHCDVVFMGRGTKNLYTAWVPLGDVPLSVGGLILVEGSHNNEAIRSGYCTFDVDTVCENKPDRPRPMEEAGHGHFGALGKDIRAIREGIGARLLTAREFRMGDLLTFSIYTVHGSLDNGSNQIRLSSDSRYQLASDPIDERWVGENPPGHGGESVRGMIC